MQIAAFFEGNVGPVAKLNVQRDCRRLIALGTARRAASLAAERALQRILRYGCGCGGSSAVANSPGARSPPDDSSAPISPKPGARARTPDAAGFGEETQGLIFGSLDAENAEITAPGKRAGGKVARGRSKRNQVAPGVLGEGVETPVVQEGQEHESQAPTAWRNIFSGTTFHVLQKTIRMGMLCRSNGMWTLVPH